jgi:chemotaxis regulatin CheY-phosphate phosphatase CheZ
MKLEDREKFIKRAELLRRLKLAGIDRRLKHIQENMAHEALAIRERLRYNVQGPEKAALKKKLEDLIGELSKQRL